MLCTAARFGLLASIPLVERKPIAPLASAEVGKGLEEGL
jgi:hypothetical protein